MAGELNEGQKADSLTEEKVNEITIEAPHAILTFFQHLLCTKHPKMFYSIYFSQQPAELKIITLQLPWRRQEVKSACQSFEVVARTK